MSELVEQEKANEALSSKLSESRMMMELALQNSKITTYSLISADLSLAIKYIVTVVSSFMARPIVY